MKLKASSVCYVVGVINIPHIHPSSHPSTKTIYIDDHMLSDNIACPLIPWSLALYNSLYVS